MPKKRRDDSHSSYDDAKESDSNSNDTYVYLLLGLAMLHLKKWIRFLDDKIAWLKRQDKGPPSKSETTYLDTLMSNFGEFFELGHEYQKCKHDDLPRSLCVS